MANGIWEGNVHRFLKAGDGIVNIDDAGHNIRGIRMGLKSLENYSVGFCQCFQESIPVYGTEGQTKNRHRAEPCCEHFT